MDYLSPLEQLFPGVGSAVLSVLSRAGGPLTLRQIADLAGASHPQVGRHIDHFESLGVVERRVAGRAHLVSLTDSAASELIRRFDRLAEEVMDYMRQSAARIDPAPASIIVFGSFPRGAARANSDIDVAIIAPPGHADDDAWLELVANWVEDVAVFAGNPVAEIIVEPDEFAARRHEPLWEAISREGIVIAGASLDDLVKRSTSTGAPTP